MVEQKVSCSVTSKAVQLVEQRVELKGRKMVEL